MAEQDFIDGVKRELADAEAVGNKARAEGAREALKALKVAETAVEGVEKLARGRQKAVKAAAPENTSQDA